MTLDGTRAIAEAELILLQLARAACRQCGDRPRVVAVYDGEPRGDTSNCGRCGWRPQVIQVRYVDWRSLRPRD